MPPHPGPPAPSMASDSYLISYPHGATGYVGPDAISAFRAMVIRSALRLQDARPKGPRGSAWPARSVAARPLKDLLKMASEYSGRAYRREEVEQAIKDLTIWIEAMKSALPEVSR